MVRFYCINDYRGTGAYGGNKVIMCLLQLIAAQLAEIDILSFHVFSKENLKSYEEAKLILDKFQKETSVIEMIEKIEKMGFKWGQGNGT